MVVLSMTAATKPARAQSIPERIVYASPKGIRGLDPVTWARFKADAQRRNKSVGELLNEVMGYWIAATEGAKHSEKNGRSST